MHRHHTWSGGTRARTASLYTYVHKGCGQRGTHRNPTAAQLLQERERERGGVPTTSPPSMKSSRAGKNPGTEEQEEQQETRTPLGCYSGDLLLMSAHNDQPQVGTEKRRKKKKRMTTVHGNRKSVVVPQPHLCCCCPVYFSSPHRDFSSSSQRARRATHNTIRTVRAHAHTRGMLRATCCARRGSPPHSGRCPHVLGGP